MWSKWCAEYSAKNKNNESSANNLLEFVFHSSLNHFQWVRISMSILSAGRDPIDDTDSSSWTFPFYYAESLSLCVPRLYIYINIKYLNSNDGTELHYSPRLKHAHKD